MKKYTTSEETKKALINAAGELVIEIGVNNVSTRAIADRAGQNIGSIHYHFGNKDNLIKEMANEAIQDWRDDPFSKYIEAHEDFIHTREGQISVVRALVGRYMKVLTNLKHNQWNSRIVYELVHKHNPLQTFLFENFIKPNYDLFSKLFRRISPGLTIEEARCQYTLMIAEIIFHVENMDTILAINGRKEYSKKYLNMLETKISNNILYALGILDCV